MLSIDSVYARDLMLQAQRESNEFPEFRSSRVPKFDIVSWYRGFQ